MTPDEEQQLLADYRKSERKAWSLSNPDLHQRKKDRQRASRQKLKNEVFEAYGNACSCCGETNAEFLQIDHVNDDGADHRRSLRETSSYRGEAIYHYAKEHGFPDTLQLLCANCNQSKRFGNGVCHHQRCKDGRIVFDGVKKAG